jgi:hypothetical protein
VIRVTRYPVRQCFRRVSVRSSKTTGNLRTPTVLSCRHCSLLSDPPYSLVQDPRGPAPLRTVRAEKRDNGNPPGLRLVEMNTSSVTDHGFTRRECTPRHQSPSCRQTYTPSPNREDSSEANVSQSTSTRSGHKPLVLPEVCTKHYQREYDVKSTIQPCTARA